MILTGTTQVIRVGKIKVMYLFKSESVTLVDPLHLPGHFMWNVVVMHCKQFLLRGIERM